MGIRSSAGKQDSRHLSTSRRRSLRVNYTGATIPNRCTSSIRPFPSVMFRAKLWKLKKKKTEIFTLTMRALCSAERLEDTRPRREKHSKGETSNNNNKKRFRFALSESSLFAHAQSRLQLQVNELQMVAAAAAIFNAGRPALLTVSDSGCKAQQETTHRPQGTVRRLFKDFSSCANETIGQQWQKTAVAERRKSRRCPTSLYISSRTEETRQKSCGSCCLRSIFDEGPTRVVVAVKRSPYTSEQ